MNHLCEPQKYSSAPPNPSSNWKFVKASGFEIQDRNGSDPVLIIFVGNDRNSCYKMNYSKSSASYICNQCRIQHQKRVSARVLKYPNGEEYIRMKHDHVCEPISYPPAPEVQIIHQPFYEVRNANQPNPKLIVYIGNDRKLYYKLYYETSTGNFVCSRCKTGHNKRTIAKLLRSLNDEEYVRMKLHDCTPFELWDEKLVFDAFGLMLQLLYRWVTSFVQKGWFDKSTNLCNCIRVFFFESIFVQFICVCICFSIPVINKALISSIFCFVI